MPLGINRKAMSRARNRGTRQAFCTLLVLLASVSFACASATLFLEEPYGKLGAFTATGHAAVYLSGVCAESPLVLRRCATGEPGVVISRYNGVSGYDWVAVPLVPYLYAVERTEDVPLFADARMVSFLRDQYRRKHLAAIVPDRNNGEAPGGNWYELVGSSYDRTVYGFEVQTTAEQDDRVIEALNSRPNQSHFRTVSRNCADFVEYVFNLYYPKALHRNFIADIGIATPKQMAKSLVRYGERHPQSELRSFVIPQVPGSLWRSTAVHGVVESFLKSKKYVVPAAVLSPITMGSVAAVYVGTGIGRFDPVHGAQVYNAQGELEKPLGAEDRRSYEKELEHILARIAPETKADRIEKSWERLQAEAQPQLDEDGSPSLQIKMGEQVLDVGISPKNVLSSGTPPRLVQQLLEARLRQELRRGGKTPKVSESDLVRDWSLLRQAMGENDQQVAAQPRRHQPESARYSAPEHSGGNYP
jgi:hypothetical protein